MPPANDSDTALFRTASSNAKAPVNVEAGDIFSGWQIGDDTSFSYNISTTAADNNIAIIFVVMAVLLVFGLVGFVVYKNV
ncbi:MAG: hypothetical protein IT273_14645 [Chitinophagales bacterium]|nr:hypothetical protein [Chitinophagales bacterium]